VIKAAVVIGQDQSLMEEALETQAPDIPYTLIDPADKGTVMARAIQAATAYVHGGDVILLAPACASMDQFVSYADRGDQFAAQARSWIQAQGLADQEAASAATETPPAPAVSDSEDHPQA
ncbi:MAG: UDP-N-acetylmuramoyl-L-alanine--D-glutamate ligase, partial [Parascardovia denticolens]